MNYEEYKDRTLDQLEKDLYLVGFIPEKVEWFIKFTQEVMNISYYYGSKDNDTRPDRDDSDGVRGGQDT